MKKHLLFAAVVALLCSCAQKSTMPRIQAQGNQFVTESGETFVFRGLCLSDPAKMIKDSVWGERVFAEAEAWGANVVRFPVYPQFINLMGWEEYMLVLDQGIEWAKLHHMYSIIDWHSIGNLKTECFTNPMYNTTWDETIRFWSTISSRYADEPAVALYELFNEPTYTAPNLGEITWTEWRGMLETIIDTIRVHSPKTTCLCAGFNWAYDLTPVAAEPIARANVAYVSHPYPMKRDQPWEEQWEADWGYVADTYPVVCTELGYSLEGERGAHIPVISTDAYAEHITRYMDDRGISFTIWCFDPHWGPMLISDWDFTPTTSGRYFKPYLQSKH